MSPFGAQLQKLFTKCAYAFVALLPFLVPFDANRNIDMQGLILLIAGGLAWGAIILNYRAAFQNLSSTAKILSGSYVVACLLSLLITHDARYALVGEPYVRLGSLGLIATVGCGLILQRLEERDLIKYVYGIISLMAIISVPYTLLMFYSLDRISGLVAQADVFGVLIGCALLLGLELIKGNSRWRNYLIANQLLLSGLLILSGTRAAIMLTIGLAVLWQIQISWQGFLKWLPVYVLLGLSLIGILGFAGHSRLTDSVYARDSLSYRRDIQLAALRSSLDKPIFGYGAGNLESALNCDKFSSKALRKTCGDGYFFNSSHNIFIDRALGIGWPGALLYLALVSLAIYKGLRNPRPEVRIIAGCALLIAGYYMTNVTSVVLEVLFWILLLRCEGSFVKKAIS